MKPLVPAIIWLIIITYLSTRGTIPMPKFNLIGADKFGHAAAYGLLTWLILLGATRMKGRTSLPSGTQLGIFLFATGYGILMEFVQANFFPNRFFEYDDMLANTIGAAIGWFFFAQVFPTANPERIENAFNRVAKIVNRKS